MHLEKLKFLHLLLIVFFFSSCGQQSKKTEDQYISDAKAKYDEKKFDEAITSYREFLKNYPKSSQAIYAYNQIAGIQIENMKDQLGAINTYKELAANFPDTKEAKQSLFMVAFIYDETLKDKENAKNAYKAFLEKYPTDTDPNDKMSESARTMLQVLESGKSIEEMIQEKIGTMDGSQNSKVDLEIKDGISGPNDSGPQGGNVNSEKENKMTDSETPVKKAPGIDSKPGEDPAKK